MNDNNNLIEIYIYNDLLERRLYEMNALNTFNDTNSMLEFESMKLRTKKFRSFLDKKLNNHMETFGELADKIEDIISKNI